jgi:hypothetical protein
MDESFKLYRKHARPTSIMAAEAIYPHLTMLKNGIIKFAAEVGPSGFTDIEMNEHFDTIKSTYRARRSEITREGIIVDSGRMQWHDKRWHTIWVHKDYKKDLT